MHTGSSNSDAALSAVREEHVTECGRPGHIRQPQRVLTCLDTVSKHRKARQWGDR